MKTFREMLNESEDFVESSKEMMEELYKSNEKIVEKKWKGSLFEGNRVSLKAEAVCFSLFCKCNKHATYFLQINFQNYQKLNSLQNQIINIRYV